MSRIFILAFALVVSLSLNVPPGKASEVFSTGPSDARFVIEFVMTEPIAERVYSIDPFSGERSISRFSGACQAEATIENRSGIDAHIGMLPTVFYLIDEDPRYTFMFSGIILHNMLRAGSKRQIRLTDWTIPDAWRRHYGLESTEENFESFENFVERMCSLSTKTSIDYHPDSTLTVSISFENGETITGAEMLDELRILLRDIDD